MKSDRTSGSRLMKWQLAALVVLLLVHLRFLAGWAAWMWNREHYQFFPVIILGSAWLAWQRFALIRWPQTPGLSVRTAIYGCIAVMLFLLAVRTNSDWFGFISFLAALWTGVWYFGGRSAASELRGPVGFLLLIVPLPLNLDLQAIIGLQKVATWLASGALDLRGMRHTVSGVVLGTPEKSYLVEEACSGVHSLFSAVSAMTFVAVYCRYSVFRLCLTIVQTIGWVLAANAFRVFLLVFVDSRWQISLDTGWRHDALGFGTYALVLLFSLSTDQLLRFIFPVAVGSIAMLQEQFNDLVVQPWNRFVAALLDEPKLSGWPAILLPCLLIAFVYLPLGSLSAAQRLIRPQSESGTSLASSETLKPLTVDCLPERIDDWTRTEFESEERSANDAFGMNSYIWTYAGPGMSAFVSVDGMYSEWHDLAYCYTATGWKLESARNATIPGEGMDFPFTVLRLYKSTGESAVVMFSCFDAQNQPVQPNEASGDVLRNLRNRLASGGIWQQSGPAFVPPVFQIQLVMSDREPLPHEMKLLEQLFSRAASEIRGQMSAGQ